MDVLPTDTAAGTNSKTVSVHVEIKLFNWVTEVTVIPNAPITDGSMASITELTKALHRDPKLARTCWFKFKKLMDANKAFKDVANYLRCFARCIKPIV